MKMDTRWSAAKAKTVMMISLTVALLTNINGALADINTDTDTILNWAEQTFPDVLPSHQPTQTLSPWLYRAYANTDIFTGINTQDNGVYYITGKALRNGELPIFFKSMSALLSEIAPRLNCDASKIPAGHIVSQQGNVLKVSTNGCIPEPLDTIDYCPQQAKENGISVKSTRDVTVTANGVTDTINLITCTINVSPEEAIPTIDLDVCYTNDSTPPVDSHIKGKIVYEQVEDCLKTDAATVEDIKNDRYWVNTGDVFQQLKKLIFNQ